MGIEQRLEDRRKNVAVLLIQSLLFPTALGTPCQPGLVLTVPCRDQMPPSYVFDTRCLYRDEERPYRRYSKNQ